jgi:hypothetical protein
MYKQAMWEPMERLHSLVRSSLWECAVHSAPLLPAQRAHARRVQFFVRVGTPLQPYLRGAVLSRPSRQQSVSHNRGARPAITRQTIYHML